VTVYRRPDPIPLRDAMPAHGGLPLRHGGQAMPAGSGNSSGLLSGSVATRIVRGLMDGDFSRDGILWTEPQLCGTFGVSRTALREAIKILSAKGILETRRKRGTAVLPPDQWNLLDPEVIGWLSQARPDQTARELRQLLDILLAGLTAAGAGSDKADGLERLNATGNRFLVKLAKTIAPICVDSRTPEVVPADPN
jgi:DNA-binding FadR family transcriptional regulator